MDRISPHYHTASTFAYQWIVCVDRFSSAIVGNRTMIVKGRFSWEMHSCSCSKVGNKQ